MTHTPIEDGSQAQSCEATEKSGSKGDDKIYYAYSPSKQGYLAPSGFDLVDREQAWGVTEEIPDNEPLKSRDYMCYVIYGLGDTSITPDDIRLVDANGNTLVNNVAVREIANIVAKFFEKSF